MTKIFGVCVIKKMVADGMKLECSRHWKAKKSHRKDIADGFIIYTVQNSSILKDKYWEDALNAICRVPPSGRLLKVVYKRLSKDRIKVITAFWLD